MRRKMSREDSQIDGMIGEKGRGRTHTHTHTREPDSRRKGK